MDTKTCFLDLDLYKLVNQCAVLKCFPDVDVVWTYTSRNPEMRFTEEAFSALQERLKDVIITQAELEYLAQTCPYFPSEYLEYLAQFRYNLENLTVAFKHCPTHASKGSSGIMGNLEISSHGKWVDTTLFESAILQVVSEVYHAQNVEDLSEETIEGNAYAKAAKYIQNGIRFAEFGSRRRISLRTLELALKGMQLAQIEFGSIGNAGKFLGSSNVNLCRKLGLQPQATMSHEWFMGVGAYVGNYERCNEIALSHWVECYGPWLSGDGMFGLALPDTFGSDLFFRSFNTLFRPPVAIPEFSGKRYPQIFSGLRNDSGDSIAFIKMAETQYKTYGMLGQGAVSPSTRPLLMFSETEEIHMDLCLQCDRRAHEAGFRTIYAVSHNDSDLARQMNVVFKLSKVAGRNAVKLSDTLSKAIGDRETIERILDVTTRLDKGSLDVLDQKR